jgi:hypothetical protein
VYKHQPYCWAWTKGREYAETFIGDRLIALTMLNDITKKQMNMALTLFIIKNFMNFYL